VNLGATAIGTGINAPAGYGTGLVPPGARSEQRRAVVMADNLIEATRTPAPSCSCRACSSAWPASCRKTCNDLRLLSSGPQAGFGDINLPARQAGSSIMPGKVNPVIPR
jgi:aspartate ammonia-lyase